MSGRAKSVCINCHTRKLRCDLQSSADGICSICRRSGQACVPRQGVRRRRSTTRHHTSIKDDSGAASSTETRSLGGSAAGSADGQVDHASGMGSTRFVSHCSTMYYGEYSEAAAFDENLSVTSSYARDALLRSIRDDAPPRPIIFQAWAEAYMSQAFHHCPVIEKSDLNESSTSSGVKKAVSMAANLMRHDSNALKIANELYERLKVLIAVNAEPDAVQNLKMICLLMLWSPKPSTPVIVDGPWHWIGIGLRLAVRMGLHRESTYARRADASCLRKIFWYLQNNESLHVSCWGYPPHLRPKDIDVHLPTMDDFPSHVVQGSWFVESTKLCAITSWVSDLRAERRSVRPEEVAEIRTALCDWVRGLPAELQLFNADGSRGAYHRPVSELTIQYLTSVIVNEFLRYKDNVPSNSGVIIAVVAGSCGTVLYDEILARDETIYLPHTHGFFCLALALPLLHFIPQSAARLAARERDLAILRSVLTVMSERSGDTKLYIRMMDRLKSNVGRIAQRSEQQDEVALQTSTLASEWHKLFPFPLSFCDNMELMIENAGVDEVYSVNDFAMPDEGLFDLEWLESIGVALGNTGFDEMAESQNSGFMSFE